MSNLRLNIGGVYASYYLTFYSDKMATSLKKLSSGNNLSDPTSDAAGVAVSANLTARMARLSAATKETQNVVSFAQTTDGFLSTIQQQLTRMSELAQKATNGSFSTTDIANYNVEFAKLLSQVDTVVVTAKFNSINIFTTGSATIAISADANTDLFASTSLGTSTSLGIQSLTIGSTTAASTAITSLTTAIASIARRRAEVNADVSKFNFYVQNTQTENINVQTTNSRITDIDVASEMANLTRYSILMQSSTAMLVQANVSEKYILPLLQNG